MEMAGMADIIAEAKARSRSLRNEAARLLGEADELDASIAQILEGHRKLAAQLPKVSRTRATRATDGKARAPTMTDTIRESVEKILRERGGGPIPTADLVQLLGEHYDIQVTGRHPVNNLSAKLSLAKGRFESHGRQGWSLPTQADNGADDNPSDSGALGEGGLPTGNP